MLSRSISSPRRFYLALTLLMTTVMIPAVGAEPAQEGPREPAGPASPAAERPAAERPAAERPAAERPAAEHPAAEHPAAGPAEKAAPEASQFIRVRRDSDKKPVALETAVVQFTATSGPYAGVNVDLIGVVHVGEKAYYDELNKRFASYDAVLYELVAAEGQNVPQPGKKRGGAHPIGALQMGMKSMLELEFQLDHIDYTPKNMVHADMSPSEFAATMKDRGESFLEMFFRMVGQGAAQQSKDPARSNDLRVFSALFSRDRATKLKEVMAEQFEAMDGSIAAFDGPDGSTIITERNKKALDVLVQQVQSGKKRLAVFYGAGHLPDMQRRLEADFGMKRSGDQWLVAWLLAKDSD